MSNNLFIRDFTNLNVWQSSRELVNDIYKVSEKFPSFEKYAMRSQLLRASTAIGANIAEGNTSMYRKKELSYLDNAVASAGEVRHWLITASDQNYITKEEFQELDARIEEIIKMICGCIKRVRYEINNSKDNEYVE